MFLYLFKIIIIFPILFFLIIRPFNELLLKNHLIPYLNNLFINHSEISFDHSIDNLILKINDTSHYYSLPFNEYYIMFFVIFFSKIFLRECLHFHILNFTLLLCAPFFYFCISYKIDDAFTFFSIIQDTVNFYFFITLTFNFLKKYGTKSSKMELNK